jgi:acyl carrier protein
MIDVTRDDIAADLESFLKKRFQIPDNDPDFTRDANLWEAGFVDSSGVAEMITHLERSFRLAIPDSVLFSPQFATINGIASLLWRLRSEPAVQSTGSSLHGESPECSHP